MGGEITKKNFTGGSKEKLAGNMIRAFQNAAATFEINLI